VSASKRPTVLECAAHGCKATIPNHQWGKIRDGADWFQQKDGTVWCPDHTPTWVAAWRAGKAKP
jgi:hypothetical protein